MLDTGFGRMGKHHAGAVFRRFSSILRFRRFVGVFVRQDKRGQLSQGELTQHESKRCVRGFSRAKLPRFETWAFFSRLTWTMPESQTTAFVLRRA